MNSAVQSMGDLGVMQMQAAASPTAPSSASGAGRGSGNIDATSQNFESMFMTQMLQPMFDTVDVDPNFGGGHAEEIMRSFLLQEYGKIAAKSGKLGIAAAVKSEMIKSQSVGSSAANTNGVQNAPAS